ncbi:TVP38/TMEM64 family protein [Rhodococcus sp. BP-252]|uniref:TVP38/TMEM64 family membrane protein n=1 Tax=Rhodococcoides kyotonense TaxID=398843 RepID=A0A177YI39_9NOCA|nr:MULTISPECIES: TVP38/TMEM64 family protein [Rhodococcus]MBY6410026.1 TVP38/TMEM64 family protein [Rhodococcus sp. BP-320]MBY6414995.1 TVP38/TMEM64 family protein [Rhodococcus sp. BP-321]MBY6421302.1 TVP38/TMEM64 family protein [Rhodococcus sp. BP-324]MBY6425697.1 TVP38/TMEM64 family protein [Rhodococcus sp. BP-323]MBY6429891.1 TVP38/TMEM64 family protein [Rhodococcus sp. BP-322]
MAKRLRDPRFIGLVVLVVVLTAAALIVPHPSIAQVRAWAQSIGPLFPVVFFAVHTIVTIAPVPRTLFTLSAGVLFGPAIGLTVTVGATTVSAVLALLLVRAVGREWFATRLTHPAVKAIDDSLIRRGWLAVGSLRLIAPVPFSVVNYCCGVSSIRVLPFAAATAVGVVPGTIGIVVLGDALGGHTDPLLLALSGVCIAVGVVGLVVDWRLSVTSHRRSADTSPSSLDA